MIVRDLMTAHLVTVAPDDTLAHAAGLLRQYQFHHLPVVHTQHLNEAAGATSPKQRTILLLQGMITTQDIDMAVALAGHESSSELLHQPWQERRVVEVMQPVPFSVTPMTSITAVAQLLVERGFDYLPVVESLEEGEQTKEVLIGLLTRSDLLLGLARSLGACEPGMQIDILLPEGRVTPLAQALQIADELGIHVRCVMASPMENGVLHQATLRLGTIYPTPFLSHLEQAHIQYIHASQLMEEDSYAR